MSTFSLSHTECANSNKRASGFTIVELLIVIVIIAILATITIIAYNGITQRATRSVVDSHLSELVKGVEMYNAENGSYPFSPTDISAVTADDQYLYLDTKYCVATTTSNGKSYYRMSNENISHEGVCQNVSPGYAVAPESCFGFNAGTNAITAYYANQSNNPANPACPTEFTIPTTIGGVAVLRTVVGSFSSSQIIKKVALANGMVEVGVGSFASSSLQYVYIPSTVTSIPGGAFYATKLKTVYIPASVESVASGVFTYNSELESAFVAMDSTDSSPPVTLSGAFHGASNLKSVWLGKSVSVVEYAGAVGSSKLEELHIMDGTTPLTLDAVNLSGNAILKDLVLPSRTILVTNGSFSGVTGLKTVTIKDGGTAPLTVTNGAFQNINSLASVTLPSNTVDISGSAFSGTPSLKNVTIRDGTSDLVIGYYVFSGTGLESFTLPKQTKSIGDKAFYNSTQLSSVTFPQGLESIGEETFIGTALTTVSLPTATTIQSNSFPVGTTITRF